MKKFVLLFSGALILFSCAKQVETPAEVPAGKTYTITAELDNPATRSLTSYDETINKFMFSWEQNEVIGVVPDGYSTILDFKSVNPSNGVFSFEQRPDDPNEYDSFVMAVSPRAALSDVTTGENTVSYSINYIGQYFQEQSNAIMVAGTPTPESDGTQHFKFKHVGALVKVSYANVPAGTHAMVFSTPDHNITGSFTFNSATGVEAVASTATTGTEARVVFLNEPTENQESVDFYLPIPTGQYQTFNVKLVKLVGEEEVTIDGSEQTFSTTSPFTVARADVVRCPVISLPAPTKGNEWSYTFESSVFNENGTQTLNGKTWSLNGEGGRYWGYNETKGEQFGSGNNPYTTMTLSSNFGSLYGISEIVINTSGGQSIDATVSVSVGQTALKCGDATTATLTDAATAYSFKVLDKEFAVGKITISYSQTSSKALYVKSIKVNPDDRLAANLEYNPVTYEATIGKEFQKPTLSFVAGFDGASSITYAIGDDDDPTVATVNETTGAVTIGTTPGTVTVTASFPGNETYKPGSASYTLTVKEDKPYDVLTNDWTGITGTTYTLKTDLNGSYSDAVYNVNAAGGNSAIQLNSTSPHGIVSVVSGGTLKKITIKWNSNTSDARVVDIYGSNTAYSGTEDLYGDNAGTKVTSFKKSDGDGSYTFESDYEYIGIRSSGSGAAYLDEIDIEWTQITWNLAGITITTHPTKTEYIAGETFDPSGMVVTASYVDANNASNTKTKTVTDYSYSPDDALATSNNSVTITYSEAGITKTADVSISVLPIPDWSLTGISITQEPTKKNYSVGDYFDPTGMIVTASYVDQLISTRTKSEVIALDDPNLTFTPSTQTPLELTDTKVTVSYQGKTADQAISVSNTLDYTATLRFGNNYVKVNSANVTGNDDLGNTWTITTEGTTSFTPNADYCQIGSSKIPATSITFTTTLNKNATIKSMSAEFGGYSGTAGTVNLKVDDTVIGSGSLNGSNDVTVSSTSTEEGTVLTVTVTGIDKGVKVYNIVVTYNN